MNRYTYKTCNAGVSLLCLMLPVGITLLGCGSKQRPPTYQTLSKSAAQNSLGAQRANQDGLQLVRRDDLKGAETKFREALDDDLYYAPAHNNLGLVLLQTQRHYEAAWEFQYAAKLTPQSAEPRQNLALLYENLGNLDQAIDAYESALDIDPNNIVAMRHLARAYVRANRNDDSLKNLLEKLLNIPTDHQWDVWIRGQLVRLGRPDSDGKIAPLGGRN